MRDLASRLPADTSRPLTFEKRGEGTLFYTARLRYAATETVQTRLDNGIAISRSYAPLVDGVARGETRTFKAGDLVVGALHRGGRRCGEDLPVGVADDRALRDVEHLEVPAVHVQVTAAGVLDERHRRRVVHERLEAVLALAQRLP